MKKISLVNVEKSERQVVVVVVVTFMVKMLQLATRSVMVMVVRNEVMRQQ